jgi:Ca2+-binding RTX toxin-like protein
VKKREICRCGFVSTALVGVVISTAVGAETFPLGGEGAIIMCPYLPIEMTEIPVCNGKKATCIGTDGHDIIWGTDSPDVIYAGAGNDIVQGDEGNDTICGGPGNDALHGARGDDEIFGDDGSDWLFGARGNDMLWGGPGDFDVLWAGPGEDQLDGGPGDKDACLQQRDGGLSNEESCEAIHPPVGYVHGEEGDLGGGIIGPR